MVPCRLQMATVNVVHIPDEEPGKEPPDTCTTVNGLKS
jgi:hypothetical protein